MRHYYVIAEAGGGTWWWISFPGRDGIVSAAAPHAGQIVPQAQAALASALMHGGRLPPAIEDGATPPDLSGFARPVMVVVVPFAGAGGPAAAKTGARALIKTLFGRLNQRLDQTARRVEERLAHIETLLATGR